MNLADVKKGSRFVDTKHEVLAENFGGKKLNSPNDAAFSADGSVWFTDPMYGYYMKGKTEADMPWLDESANADGVGFRGVYRLKDGKLELVSKTMDSPNGIAFSPDGKILWVSNSNQEKPSFTAYAVTEELPLKPMFTIDSDQLGPLLPGGVFDGFKVDEEGRIWTSMPAGVGIIDPKTKSLVAQIAMNVATSNIEFGADGDVWVTGVQNIWRLKRR